MWEILFAMERCDYRAGDEDPGATTLVLDLAKPFERVYVSLSSRVWALATHFDSFLEDFASVVRVLQASEARPI